MLRVYGLRRYKQREDAGSTDITGTNSVTGASIPPFDLLANSTICTIVKEIQLSRPELAFIIATRAILGARIALLLADRTEQRKAVGCTLVLASWAGQDNSRLLGLYSASAGKSVEGREFLKNLPSATRTLSA
jgi:hypothetical protein